MRVKRRTFPTNIELKKAYNKTINISEQKKKDLLSLVNSNHIPKYYGTFYIFLILVIKKMFIHTVLQGQTF